MPNPNQVDLLDGMIARLEKANEKAYEQFARADERASKSGQDSAHPSEKHDPPIAPPASRTRPFFVAVIWLLLIASACATAFAWQSSYGDAAKLTIRGWTNAWVMQIPPQALTTPREGVLPAPLISPEIAQPLQRMADDLANLEQQIEQLKATQEHIIRSEALVAEQLRTSQEQMVRDNARVFEQLRTSQEQMVRDNARVVEQLNAALAQMARYSLTVRRRSIAKR